LGIYQPFSFAGVGWRHRQLIRRLSWRRIQARYRGTVLGRCWVVIQPLLLLSVYTFVFSVVFEARWGSSEASGVGRYEFALFLFSGILLFSIFSECVNAAPQSISDNQIYIRQLKFPVEVFAWVTVFTSLFTFAIGLLILGLFYFVIYGLPPESWLFVPVAIVPMVLLTLGLVWFVSSIAVYFRDAAQITAVLTTALFFLSPIFYPVSRIPEVFRDIYLLNPLASMIEMFRGALLANAVPDPWVLVRTLLVGWVVAWLGFVWFMKTKRGFSDVL